MHNLAIANINIPELFLMGTLNIVNRFLKNLPIGLKASVGVRV